MKTYNVLCLSEAVSPITHMRGVSGNESLVMREPVVSPQGVAWVPCLSANAIRHQFVREPVHRFDVSAARLVDCGRRVRMGRFSRLASAS